MPLAGAHNFRDLGGYPTRDGRRTRWGRLFRSDALSALTVADVAALRALGLAAVLDLRSPSEVERDGRGPLGDEPLAYANLPLIPEVERREPEPEGTEPDVAALYLEVLEVGGEAAARALNLISDAGGPLVFHCTAGKDRTGVLAAVVLGCLGVTPEAIVADYVATSERMPLVLEALRRNPAYRSGIDRAPAARLAALPETMRRFLSALDERFGGPREWARAAGVSAAALDRLERGLLE